MFHSITMPQFLYPGHKYLGPGNPLNNGQPVDVADKIARSHDFAYSYSKTKNEIFDADKQAIDKFRTDLSNNFNFPSAAGFVGLSAKHFVESGINKTLYPFNLPDDTRPMKRKSTVPANDPSPKKPISGDLPTESAASVNNSEPMAAVNEPMQMDAATPDGNPGVSGAHGQTAKLFDGTAQTINESVLTFKKTYRFRSKASPPQWARYNNVVQLRHGSMFFIPVNNYWWYLSPAEFASFKQYETAVVKDVSTTIYNYGVRLPFKTNETKSTIANASAQYPLCQWIGLDDVYQMSCNPDELDRYRPFVTGGDFSNLAESQTPFTWNTEFDEAEISARTAERDFDLQAHASILLQPDSESEYQPNFHQYAHTINGTMNLGKVFEHHHTVQNGLIHARLNGRIIDYATLPVTKGAQYGIARRHHSPAFFTEGVSNSYLAKDMSGQNASRVMFNGQQYTEGIENCKMMNSLPGKMPGMYVGMQTIRNENNVIIDAVWEWAAETTISVKVTKGAAGRYWLTQSEQNVGPENYYEFGNDQFRTYSSAHQRDKYGHHAVLYSGEAATTNKASTFQASGKVKFNEMKSYNTWVVTDVKGKSYINSLFNQ